MTAGEKIIWWRVVLVLAIVFAASSIALAKLLSLAPDSSKLSPWVTLGLPLALAWFVAAVVGRNIVPAKHALTLATICLLVAAPLAYFKPWERGGGWQPGGGEVPENFQVPENYVAFRFVSSFTYVGSEGNQPITDVELELPWPYIDAYENGRPAAYPVGLDNWLQKTYVLVDLQNPGPEMREWLWNVWKLENVRPENTPGFENYYRLENAVWSVELALPGLPYKQVGFDPSLKLYHGDRLEWVDNHEVELLGGRTAEPTITAYIESWARSTVFQKVTVKLSDMRPGETVSIEGTFLVAEENAPNVRLDDWIESGMWRTFKPEQENAPLITDYWLGESIRPAALSQLEKLVDGDFVLVVKYEETWGEFTGGTPYGGLIDGKITR